MLTVLLISNVFSAVPPGDDEAPSHELMVQAQGPGGGEGTRSDGEGVPLYTLYPGEENEYYFGYQVTNVGDLQADGMDDLIVGYFLDEVSSDRKPGSWGNYLLPGRDYSDPGDMAMTKIESVSTMWDIHSNRWIGDVNGDGYSDMVSMPKTSWRNWDDVNATTPPSYIDVRYGGAKGIGPNLDVSIHYPIRTDERYGRWELPTYGGSGDVNGDGYNDLVVIDELELELFYGSASGISTSPNFTTTLEEPDNAHDRWDRYYSLDLGDVNGDGYADLVLSDIAGPWITVYYGSEQGVTSAPDAIDYVDYNHRMTVTSPVNVNGDEYDDVVIEYRVYDNSTEFLAIEVYLGSPDGLPNKPSSTDKIWEDKRFMHSRNILFVDINGDSLDDILIEHDDPGNWTYDNMNGYNEYSVYFNQEGSYPPVANFVFQVPGNFSGYSAARWGLNDVGDFDGDGFGDVAIGIPAGSPYAWGGGWGEHPRRGYLLIIHGKGIMERIAGLALPGEPTLYAAYSECDIIANLATSEGQGAVVSATLTLDPGGADVEILWNGEVDGNPFSVVSDPLGCVELLSGIDDVETDPSTGDFRPHFKFRPRWEWPHEDPVDVELRIRTTNGELGPLPSTGMFNVVTSLEFKGSPTLRGEWQGQLEEGDWVRAGELVNITDIRVVYAGSVDIEPNCEMTPSVTDDDGDSGEGLYDPEDFGQVSINMDEETDLDEVLTLSMKDLPGNGVIRENLSIHLPVDGDLPVFGNPVPDDQDWHAVTSVMASMTITDVNGSGPDPTTLEYSWRTRDGATWSDWTRNGLGVATHLDMVDGLVTLVLEDGDENRVRWRAKDLVGNGYAEYIQTIKVDTLNVSYADPFPDPDEWLPSKTYECSVSITDLEGSGIDVSTIQYRVSARNLSQYGEWTDWDEGAIGDSETLSPLVTVELTESVRNYIQWRAIDIAGNGFTTSPHYLLRVDMTPPIFEDFSPGPDEMGNSTEVECEVTVRDNPMGSGVDLASMKYRYALNGTGQSWSEWMDVGMTGVTDTRFSVIIELSHGRHNLVQFQCFDVAGNGPVESEEHHVAVDVRPPVILWIEPAGDEKQPDGAVKVRVGFQDDLAGVDHQSISYAFSTDGVIQESDSSSVDEVTVEGTTIIGSIDLTMVPGRDNVVRFVAVDMVGNQVVSEVRSIWVNSPPVAIITSPLEGTQFPEGEDVVISGEGSTDPDGDPLGYSWLLDGSNTASGEVANLTMEVGSHNLTLVVWDDIGAEDRTTITISVEEWIQPHTAEEPIGVWLPLTLILLLVLAVAAILIWRTRVGERSGE